MDVFEKQYSAYRRVLSFIGLWPYHKSVYTRIKRVMLPMLTIVCITIQIVSIIVSDVSLKSCLLTLSSTCPVTLFLVRYVSFIHGFPLIQFFFDEIRKDQNSLKDPYEVMTFTKYITDSSRVIAIFLSSCCIGIVIFLAILFTPIVLDLIVPQNETRIRYIYYMTVLFTDEIKYVDLISLNSAVVITFGLLTVSCTESMLSVMSYYISGLFKIASYRIRTTIINATNSTMKSTSKQIEENCKGLQRAVDMHMKGIECICIVVTNVTIPYLIASLLVVISFAVNLHRFSQAIEAMDDLTELLVSIMLVSIHMMFMFFNNYCGQMVIDDGLGVFEETYNSTWYCIPASTQKLLIFIMMRSAIQCSFNLSGLFTPCYQGFSVMMSSSFSYFTVMYSFQQN